MDTIDKSPSYSSGMNETRPLYLTHDTQQSDIDRAIADSYHAYLPALSSNHPNRLADSLQSMSLGSDSRRGTDPDLVKYQENVADRNIARWGSRITSKMEHDAVPSHADRVARDKSNIPRQSIDAKASLISNDSGVVDGVQRKSRLIERKTPRVERPFNGNDSDDKRNGKIHALAQRVDGAVGSANLDGIVDLEDSVDTDKQTRWAPAVVHETVKPHVHEIREEKIYREIHHYDVNHYVQPVFETVLLPARHFMSNPHDEGLIEVSEDQLPGCTGKNQRWTINKKEDSMPQSADKPAKLTAPKVISDKTNMMPEGFERRETTIIHPPELEDMSHYKGPVMDIYFDEAGVGTELPRPSQDSVYLPNNLIPPRMASVRRKPLAPTQQ